MKNQPKFSTGFSRFFALLSIYYFYFLCFCFLCQVSVKAFLAPNRCKLDITLAPCRSALLSRLMIHNGNNFYADFDAIKMEHAIWRIIRSGGD